MDKVINYYQRKNILVTGANGYIGSALIDKLANISCQIIALSKKKESKGSFPQRKAEILPVEGDIRAPDIWEKYLKNIDVVFHFAAQTSSKISNKNPLKDVNINLIPIINLIETSQKKNFSPAVIFSGTVTQVGLTKEYPVNEDFDDNPITVYDVNKLACEKYLQYYSNQLNKKAVTLRLANVYGPGASSSSPDRGILNIMVKKALRGEDLTLYGKGDFIRDYIYIEDVAEAFLLAGAKIDKTKGNYYLIGTGCGYSLKDAFGLVKNVVKDKIKKNVNIEQIPMPEGISPIEYRNFVADTTKFKEATGWEAKFLLEEGIRNTVDYFMDKEKQ